MVADAVIYHPSVAHYLRFIATTMGRDKVLRTIQYFARFYAWYLLRTNGTATSIAPWAALKKQLGLTRKILRIGKNVEHLKAAATAADTKSPDAFLKFTSVGRQLGYAGYLSCDSATVLDAAGVKKWSKAARFQQEAYRFWAIGIICSIAGQLYTLWRLQQRETKVDKKDGEGVVESKRITLYVTSCAGSTYPCIIPQHTLTFLNSERAASRKQLLCDLCDLCVPTSALGWIPFDDGVVGLTGTLSSIIGIIAQWKKTA